MEEIFKEHIKSSCLMSGGKGSRMMPLTKKTQKHFLKLKENQFASLIRKAENEGFKDVFISINHLGSK